MNYELELKDVTFDVKHQITLPVLTCKRELVLFYFNYRNLRDSVKSQLDSNPEDLSLLKKFKELKARCARLEKAIYFQCEVSGEYRLLSSLTLMKGKIVFTRIARKIQKKQQSLELEQQLEQRAIEMLTNIENNKANLAKGQNTEDSTEQKSRKISKTLSYSELTKGMNREQRREFAVAWGKKTELERWLTGKDEDDFVWVNTDKKISEEEFMQEFRVMQQYTDFAGMSPQQIGKLVSHNILVRRARQMEISVEMGLV